MRFDFDIGYRLIVTCVCWPG